MLFILSALTTLFSKLFDFLQTLLLKLNLVTANHTIILERFRWVPISVFEHNHDLLSNSSNLAYMDQGRI